MKNLLIIFMLIFTVLLNGIELFYDDFEAGLDNWNVVNNGGSIDWMIFGEPYPNVYTLPAPAGGNVCVADADAPGSGHTIDSYLVLAAPINMAVYDDIILEFDSDFYALDTDDYCYVDVSVDGSNWTNVLTFAGASVRETHEVLDISEFASLESSVLIRFHSVQPGYDWWWAIDNVEINAEIAVALTAPAAPTDVLVTTDPAGGLSVDISWICPSEDVEGNPLTELFEMLVYRDEELIYTDSAPEIGGAGSYTDTAPDNGFFTYNVYGTNSSGVGVPVLETVFVGEDAPSAVSNLNLEQSSPGELSGTLTWINPTIGLNGGVLNEITGYTIARSDGAAFDLTGEATEYIDDTIPSSDNYWYSVQPYNTHGEGEIVMSNSVLIADEGLLIMENFDGTFPPDSWEIQGGGNWSQATTNNAGGISPEADFNWTPSTTAVQRLAILPINTVGATELDLEFKHLINDFNGDYELRIETSSDGVNWNTAQVIPSATIPATTENLVITTPDVGSGSFQIAWTFDGNSYNINHWYIDDVMLEGQLFTYDDDLAGMTITGGTIVNAGNSEIYEIAVKNVGYNTQNAYNVKLFRDNGTELASLDVTDPIAYMETVYHNLVWQIPTDEPAGVVTLHGEVTLTGDENTANDGTNNIAVTVLPPGVMQIQVGDGTGTNNRNPVCFQYNNSLSQMLYFPEELQNEIGMITELTFFYDFDNDLDSKPITLWMGETEQTNLTEGFIPSTSLTQVYDGYESYSLGINDVTITLDTPYLYEGGNLVVMAHRPWDTQSYTGSDGFYHDQTPENIDRTRYERDNELVIDPTEPPVGYGFEDFPNTLFTFYLGEMGEVEGYVYDDLGAPLVNAEIEIEELQQITYSNDQGFYHFGNVLTGTYDFTATMFGYSPQTVQEEVFADEITTIDFNLPPLGTVTVTGHVVGSDSPETGLEAAGIILDGFEYYQTTSDENGDFMISGVYTNIIYDISVSFEGYETYYGEVEVEGTNLELETIILTELSFPPGNVQATQNNQQTQVDLIWNSPGQGGGEFRYDDGVADFQIGHNSLPVNGLIGAVHRNISIIQEIHWFLTSAYGDHDDVKIIILGLTDGEPDVTQVMHISPMLDNIDDEWNTYVLEEQIEAFEGFFLGVNTPGEYTSLALDDGEGEPWIFEMGTHYTNENWLGGNEWTDIGTMGSMFERNMLLRAYGINLGNTDLASGAYKDTFTIPAEKSQKETVSKIIAGDHKESYTSSANGELREFESYNVYRFPEQNHNNPSSWLLVGEAITDTLFTDLSWGSLPVGDYQFAIRSVYTNGVESLPAFSLVLEKTIGAFTPEEMLPVSNELFANYPNPFNPETTISFSILNNNGITDLSIYNLKGQKVRTLVNDLLTAGNYSVVWNGKDDNGKLSASGIYFYNLKSGSFSSKQKMILLK